MPRSFAYVRVSTMVRPPKTRSRRSRSRGSRWIRVSRSESVSGSSAIEQRPGFIKLLNKLEHDDVLIVIKLDRLGRNAIDVATTVVKLGEMGVRVHCLALGGVDLISPAGRMTMGVINAVAQGVVQIRIRLKSEIPLPSVFYRFPVLPGTALFEPRSKAA